MTLRLLLVFGIGICLWNIWSARHLSGTIPPDQPEPQLEQQTRAGTVHQLLPQACQSKSAEWSDDSVVEPLYDCTCATLKARYFCPSQRNPEYQKWEPRAVGQGLCKSITRSDAVGEPLPLDFKVLVYEVMMCMFQEELSSKRVNVGFPDTEEIALRDMQCRSCSLPNDPTTVTGLQRKLLHHQCMAKSDTCRGEFFFGNGAAVYYTFSNGQDNKGLDYAQLGHTMDAKSTYDAVFMNPGNDPPLDAQKAIDLASEVQASGTRFFWLSTYDGVGSISEWTREERVLFFESGAQYIDVECMMRGMDVWTAGAVEGEAAMITIA